MPLCQLIRFLAGLKSLFRPYACFIQENYCRKRVVRGSLHLWFRHMQFLHSEGLARLLHNFLLVVTNNFGWLHLPTPVIQIPKPSTDTLLVLVIDLLKEINYPSHLVVFSQFPSTRLLNSRRQNYSCRRSTRGNCTTSTLAQNFVWTKTFSDCPG